MNEEIILDQYENLKEKSRQSKHFSSSHFDGFETQSQPNLGLCRHNGSSSSINDNNNKSNNILFTKSHTKTLKLFKDIKNLQSRLQNIE
jgi:hypothetical protein